MGIKSLNRFLSEKCTTHSIHKVHLSELAYKTLIIDTSIYLYKFLEKKSLLENIYLMISIFKHYNIVPVFVFDGKPPVEKKELLEKRRMEKKQAEDKYNELKHEMVNEPDEDKREDMLNELETLKKRFIRIRENDIVQVKELMTTYGVMYLESFGEADQLCAYLSKNNYAYACVSDDMDMFVYGCPRVLRHMSLIHHTAIEYNLYNILEEVNIPLNHFKDVLILSGTDYNMCDKTNLTETLKWYAQYVKYSIHKGKSESFYDWLMQYTKYIRDRPTLDKVHSMFDLTVYSMNNQDELRKVIHMLPFEYKQCDYGKLQEILRKDGFIFV
jgi:hypothetical protein